jgi:hypothetical protein
MPDKKVLRAFIQPEINKAQAVIVARALKIGGIFHLLLNSIMPKRY